MGKVPTQLEHPNSMRSSQARRQRGARGALPPPIFVPPPDLFLAPHDIFFGRKKLLLLIGKTVKSCDFGQKKPSDFGEDLFFSLKLRLNPIQE